MQNTGVWRHLACVVWFCCCKPKCFHPVVWVLSISCKSRGFFTLNHLHHSTLSSPSGFACFKNAWQHQCISQSCIDALITFKLNVFWILQFLLFISFAHSHSPIHSPHTLQQHPGFSLVRLILPIHAATCSCPLLALEGRAGWLCPAMFTVRDPQTWPQQHAKAKS